MCDKISTDELPLPMMDLPSMTPQIICVKNDLYLYNDINQDTAKNVISNLYDMALTIINSCLNNGFELIPINIHINSNGGSVPDALAIINCIEKIKSGYIGSIGKIKVPIEVNTFIEGEADSCASLIAVVGSKRYMNKYSLSLIHPARQITNGYSSEKVADIEANAENLKMFQQIIEDIYLEHSKASKKQIKELMSTEKYSSPADLLKLGIIDSIM